MSRRFGNRPRPVAVLPAGAKSPTASNDLESTLLDERDIDFSIEELREFLSADFLDVPADPAFKDELRNKLWDLIRNRTFGYGPSDD